MESEKAEEELETEIQLEKSDEYENSPERSDEKEQTESADDELISIASSDLAMADEACDGSEEEDLVDGLAEDFIDEVIVEAFNPSTFTPIPVKNIRPPWTKHQPLECDAKNWEIFVEALEAFDQDTILEGKDDFIVTIETLFPHLGACFAMLTEDGTITEKDVTSRVMIWLEVCLGKDAQAFEEAKKLHDIAFEILKTIANAPRSIGKGLIDSGMIELLVEVIEDPGSADLRLSALRSLFQLISSPSIWRELNNRLCESNLDDPHGTLYSRLIAVSVGDRYFPCKNIIPLITLIVSWSRFVTSLTQLEASAKEVFSAISHASHFNEVSISDFAEKWNEFQISLDIVREYIVEFDDEKICASFDVYAILQSSDLLSICVKLLSITRIVDKWPNVLQFIRYLLCDRYYGTLFIAHYPELNSLYMELKKLAEAQKVDELSSDVMTYDEGVWELDEKFPDAKELHLTVAYRLNALHLIDEMRACSGTLRHCIDDDQRVMALKSLCELCKEESGRGRREVVWLLAQKYVYYLVDVIDHVSSSSEVRSSACYGLAVHLLAVVVTEVDNPKFWIKHAKVFCRLISKGYIKASDHRRVCEYLVPFSNPLFQRIGDSCSDVIVGLFKKMSTIMDHKVEVNPTVTTYVRMLEAVLMHANDISRLEMYHTMERENIFEGIASWLFEIIQYRHVMWQMGEPVSSEESRTFLAFAFPILRIFAAYFRACGSLVGQVVRRGKSRRFKDTTDHFVELRPMSDALLDALFLMWSSTGGMNGQRFSEECKKIRLAVLDVLTPSIFIEKSLSLVIRHILFRSCSRTHLFPAVLSLLLTLAPWAPPLILPKTEVVIWKDVVIGHRQRVKRFVNAFISCENRADIAELLLSPNAYVSEMSLAFIERMSNLDYRLTHDLVSILLNYIATSIEGKISVYGKDTRACTPTGSVTGEELSKKNEAHTPNHASSGMVRMMESLQRLCTVNSFRMVMYDFLSRCSDRVRLLIPILTQFEKPTLESERQLRYQTAVLELLAGLCVPSLWSGEPLSGKCCPLSDFVGLSSLNGSEYVECEDANMFRGEREKIIGSAPGSPDITEISNGEDEKGAPEVHEEPKGDSLPSNCLESVLLSLCRFVNNSEQKISLVQHALVVLMDATSNVGKEDVAFVEVIRACMKHVGLLPLFKRLNESFGSDEVMTCLSAVAMVLDKIAGDKAEVLQKILRFSPSDHPLASIISHINDMEQTDERTKFVLQILDKFFHSLNDGSLPSEVPTSDLLQAPPVYGKVTEVVKIYSKPLVQVVDGMQKVHERTRAASRILVHRKHTLGTRMGSEVAKVIEANKGKEKAVRKILRSRLDIPEDDAAQSPRKKARSPAKASWQEWKV